MAHPRQEIREAVKAALLGPQAEEDPPVYATSAGARVYETRMVPWQRLKLPAIAVYTLQESADLRGTAPRERFRKLSLAVEAAVKAGENVDDALDAIALQMEAAMDVDETFGGKASDSALQTTELDVATVGDQEIGLVRLTFEVTYFSEVPVTPPTLDDFETANIRYNLSNEVHVTNEAVDSVDVEED